MSSKYEFIDGEKANYPIIKMCRWASVSRAGFYEWRSRPASATTERRVALSVEIRRTFADSDDTSGYRRVRQQLQHERIEAGPELVREIMRIEELVACQPKPYKVTTFAGDADAPADLVCRDFTAMAPGTKLVGDITEHKTEGLCPRRTFKQLAVMRPAAAAPGVRAGRRGWLELGRSVRGWPVRVRSIRR